MRALIKLFSLSCLICSVLYVFSSVADAAAQEEGKSLTFLAVGLDDSPSNTDVLSVITYDSGANTVRALQIPRDTCVRYGDKIIKINAFYSQKLIDGERSDQALMSLSDMVSDLLGIKIDGYAALTTDGFIDFVDFVGGIDVNSSDIPHQIQDSFSSKDGKVHLDGKSALRFVRYRKEYLRGDLERLDTQKIFAKSLFSSLKDKREIFSLFKFISNSDGISFDIDKGRSLSFMLQNVFKASDADFQIATLPGKSVKSEGVWYYIINKGEAESLIKGYFPYSTLGFDTENNFVYNL